MLVIGAIACLFAGLNVLRWLAARTWSVTTGEIVEARTETRDVGEYWTWIVRRRVPTYLYEVGGQEYVGRHTHLSLGGDWSHWRKPVPTRRGPVQVFYSPRNPRRAVLCRDLDRSSLVIGLIGILLILLGSLP